MRKLTFLFLLMLVSTTLFSQTAQNAANPQKFFDNLKKLEGKSFEGVVTSGAREGDAFDGKKLVMHVRDCDKNRIRIPFHVGDNYSRTWVFTLDGSQIELKHDHRMPDGSDDKVTMYGGTSTNTGTENMQFFPADQFTSDLIGYGTFNVWWVTVDDTTYTYNLHRVGTDRVFTVTFDLTKPIETPPAPWGWVD